MEGANRNYCYVLVTMSNEHIGEYESTSRTSFATALRLSPQVYQDLLSRLYTGHITNMKLPSKKDMAKILRSWPPLKGSSIDVHLNVDRSSDFLFIYII
jgi:hypothetical protein